MVGRDADGLGVAPVEQAGGQRAIVQDELARHPVDVVGDGAGLHQRDQEVQALGGQPAGAAHALEPFGVVHLDLVGAGGDVEDVAVAHEEIRGYTGGRETNAPVSQDLVTK